MGCAIVFGVHVVPDVLHGLKVAVLNSCVDESTKSTVLHETINRSAFLRVFELLYKAFMIF
jgi:hypothetical protein